jgi:3-deoxy-D-manno-octulosonic-acid transferase
VSKAPAPLAAPPLGFGARAVLGLYGLAWRMALPMLRRNKRLAVGWDERTLAAGPPPPADLWLQAASGGEAYLARELLVRLAEANPASPPRTLATTFTSQGLDVLRAVREELSGRAEVFARYVPFDRPGLMDRALGAVRPRAVALLETELWPGLLAAARKAGTPALVLNARMTDKSLAGYLRAPGLWRTLAPGRVLAVSDADAARFATLFPASRVSVMPNIKFDRLRFAPPGAPDAQTEALAALLPPGAPFVMLGSVRKQEESQALEMVLGLRQRLPGAVIGLFPRHMERVEAWTTLLSHADAPFLRRSAGRPAAAGEVLLWDAFGEMGRAFALADACFLGGSLADLGGQNFLEPLAHGVVPVIGPSWHNFAWVGEEIFTRGLARRAADWRQALDALCALAADPPARAEVVARAAAYADSRRGGTEAALQAVAECLISR